MELGAEVTNPALDLDIGDMPFLEALDRIAAQGRGHAQLLHRRRLDRPHGRAARRRSRWSATSGPFRVAFKQIAAVRDLQAGTADRQRPVRGRLGAPAPADAPERSRPTSCEIIDDQGKPVKPQVDEGVDRGRPPAREPGRRDEPEPRRPRPRRPRSWLELKVKAEVTVPAGHAGRSASPAWPQANVTQKQGDITRDARDRPRSTSRSGRSTSSSPTPARARRSRAIARGSSTTGSGSRRPTARGSSTTAASRTPAPTAASSASSTSSSTPPASPPTTSSSTRPRARSLTIPLEFEFKDVPLP